MRDDHRGQVALITGAGRGIGRETARLLAGRGAHVVVNDLDDETTSEIVDTIRAEGGSAIACVGDVTRSSFPDRFVTTALDQFGAIDIVVNNAGYVWDNVVQKTSDEQWDAMIDVHLGAPFRLMRRLQPVMRRQVDADRATGVRNVRKIVNVSSIAATAGNPGQIGYASAKAGVIGMTRTLAREWGRYDVTVNCVAFAVVETRLVTASAKDGSTIVVGDRVIPIGLGDHVREKLARHVPLGRVGTPREGAGAIALFCSSDSDYISGQTVVCGGGFEG